MFLKKFLQRRDNKKSVGIVTSQVSSSENLAHLELKELSDDFQKIALGETLNKVVYWDTEIDSHMKILGHVGSGKSVVERNILLHCIKHHEKWDIFGFDFTKIEHSQYMKYSNFLMIADVYEALSVLKNIQYEMTNRYLVIEDQSSGSEFKPFKNMLLIFDDIFYILHPNGVKTQEGKEHDLIIAEISGLLLDIAEAGKSVNIHLCAATQRTIDFTNFNEIFKNFSAKLETGRKAEKESLRLFGDNSASNAQYTQIQYTQRGRAHIQSLTVVDEMFQVYYASDEWKELNLSKLPQRISQ